MFEQAERYSIDQSELVQGPESLEQSLQVFRQRERSGRSCENWDDSKIARGFAKQCPR